MSKPIDPSNASPAVLAVFDDIKKTRNVPDVNNFWKYLASDPALLKRTWESVKDTMAPGGMNEAMFGELMAVVGMANETNRLANGYRVPIDAAFDK